MSTGGRRKRISAVVPAGQLQTGSIVLSNADGESVILPPDTDTQVLTLDSARGPGMFWKDLIITPSIMQATAMAITVEAVALYVCPSSGNSNTTEAKAQFKMPFDATIGGRSDCYFSVIGSGGTYTVELNVAGSASAIAFTFTSVGWQTDASTVSVSEGDLISLKMVRTVGFVSGTCESFSTTYLKV